MHTVREWLIGTPLPTARLQDERLNNVRALAAFSPDALSSVAYANQEIYLGLVAAGAVGLVYSLPIGLAIGGLLIVVALSYAQTIHAYPAGGGSYTVARENLGLWPGLIVAGALLIDYTLTAAVSVTAGVAAIASAFPALWEYRVGLSLVFLALITVANLRGLRESGTVMAFPVYFFLAAYLGMLLVGVVRAIFEGPASFETSAPPAQDELTLFMVLHAFASGCTALTGVEAISNGVPVFNAPETRNATRTLAVMALLMGTLFLGSVGLTQYFAIVPRQDETVLSGLARHVLGTGVPYVVVQIATLLILVVAANTSFAGFPRLASILSRDGYAPHQLSFLGDRLVFSNGMLLLAGLSGLLIVSFGGDTHALIPLFAVGVFIAFTLSQAGMVVHWVRVREAHWQIKALINGTGALSTSITLVVIAVSKFVDGAWIVIILIPLLVAMFYHIKQHYNEVAFELRLPGPIPSLGQLPPPRVIVPVAGVHRGVLAALLYARSISDNVTAVYVEVNPEATERIRQQWTDWGQAVPLVVLSSPYRSVVGPFLEYLDRVDGEADDGQLASVLLPEFVPAKWWQIVLHNQTAWVLKLALLYRRRRYGKVRAIIDLPLHLDR